MTEQNHASVQVACDRCTQGVMDSTNPHLYGECGCNCHKRLALVNGELVMIDVPVDP